MKALKADKRKDDAAAVKALRKPSAAAWAINQVARSSADDVEALFAAAEPRFATRRHWRSRARTTDHCGPQRASGATASTRSPRRLAPNTATTPRSRSSRRRSMKLSATSCAAVDLLLCPKAAGSAGSPACPNRSCVATLVEQRYEPEPISELAAPDNGIRYEAPPVADELEEKIAEAEKVLEKATFKLRRAEQRLEQAKSDVRGAESARDEAAKTSPPHYRMSDSRMSATPSSSLDAVCSVVAASTSGWALAIATPRPAHCSIGRSTG